MKTMIRGVLLAAGAVILPPLAAQTPAGFDAAKAFGARESISGISLSPDGNRLLYLAPLTGQAAAVYVAELAGGTPIRIFAADGDPEQLSSCRWITSERMMCTVRFAVKQDGRQVGFVRQFAVNRDGSKPQLLGSRRATGQSLGSVIDMLPGGDGTVLNVFGGATGSVTTGNGVERLDTLTLRTEKVINPKPGAVEYITDGQGDVRIMGVMDQPETGYSNGILRYSWRPAGGGGWTGLSTVDADGKGFNPYAVDRDRNLAYGFDDVAGRKALISVKLDGSLSRDTVLARPDVDIDDLVRIGQRGRVIGATYATERRETVYFDPQMKALAASLGKALPGRIVRIVDADAAENKLLIWAGGDVDPGRIYTFDRTSKQLNEALLVRPPLEKVALATVKPVTFTAADGTPIPGYLTLPPGSTGKALAAIVMPHGGPQARDEWGFDWLAQFYANRGYAVLQPNFRGSSGYGEAWFAKNGYQSWRIAIGDVTDAGRWLVKEGIADPAKLAIVGWSYGGYTALQSGVVDPTLFKAIVAIAPVTDFAMLKEESRNFSNYRLMETFIGKGPHLIEGSPAKNAAKIAAPVLMFHGALDENVWITESRAMEKALKTAGKPVELVTYPRLDHQLDDSTARADMLAKSDAFLRKTLGM